MNVDETIVPEVVPETIVPPETMVPETVVPEVVPEIIAPPETIVPEVVPEIIAPPETMVPETVVPEVVPETIVPPEVFYPETVVPDVVVPDIVSMSDLINEHATIVQRESTMNAFLTSQLITVNPSTLKPKLIIWATLGFPAIYPILNLQIDIPNICADGVSRSLQAFVEYLLGAPLSLVIESLSAKLPGMDVSYSCSGSSFSIHVSKV
jgi:hypothetical protein